MREPPQCTRRVLMSLLGNGMAFRRIRTRSRSCATLPSGLDLDSVGGSVLNLSTLRPVPARAVQARGYTASASAVRIVTLTRSMSTSSPAHPCLVDDSVRVPGDCADVSLAVPVVIGCPLLARSPDDCERHRDRDQGDATTATYRGGHEERFPDPTRYRSSPVTTLLTERSASVSSSPVAPPYPLARGRRPQCRGLGLRSPASVSAAVVGGGDELSAHVWSAPCVDPGRDDTLPAVCRASVKSDGRRRHARRPVAPRPPPLRGAITALHGSNGSVSDRPIRDSVSRSLRSKLWSSG